MGVNIIRKLLEPLTFQFNGGFIEMLDLTKPQERSWHNSLRPINEGGFNKEVFEDWWLRNHDLISHLPKLLCEQWIYRHWQYAKFDFIPLDTVKVKEIYLSTEEIFTQIHREYAPTHDADFDFKAFQGRAGKEKHPTARAIDKYGTWDYPIITLSTPRGLVGERGDFINVPLVLIEGHQRHRYLYAIYRIGKAVDTKHCIFVLHSKEIN